ncbi:SMEK domain-containing protein [Paraburkholderia phytofirmans]|uniref:SMEK domain-containing protein n=1 Tax=Paraburkholderia phytofirmans TaxID=261302 RepID=A0ABW9BJW3_9BURK
MPLQKAALFENVVMKLSVLRYMVKSMTKRGKTDINRDCETFFAEVLNRIYGYKLENVNVKNLNTAAIDLADDSAKLCVQVTSTSDSSKIKKTIKVFLEHDLDNHYDTLLVLILGEKRNYTTKPDGKGRLAFDIERHVLDIDDVLEQAETLDLDRLTALSEFVDREMPGVARALEPDSLLAAAERNDGRPAVTATRLLTVTADSPVERNWVPDFESLTRLQVTLMSLSRKQREVVLYLLINHTGKQFGRVRMPAQTLEQKLLLSQTDMVEYFRALEAAGVMGYDEDDRMFELDWRLTGSHSDFFTVAHSLFTRDELPRLIVDCDFSLLD